MPPNWIDSDDGKGKRISPPLMAVFPFISPLRNGKGAERTRWGPWFIYLDICSQNTNCIFLLFFFVGKLKRCHFTIQIKAKNTSSCVISWEWEEGASLYYVWHSCMQTSQRQKTFTAWKKRYMLRKKMHARVTHCYSKSPIWDTGHNAALQIVQFQTYISWEICYQVTHTCGEIQFICAKDEIKRLGI